MYHAGFRRDDREEYWPDEEGESSDDHEYYTF